MICLDTMGFGCNIYIYEHCLSLKMAYTFSNVSKPVYINRWIFKITTVSYLFFALLQHVLSSFFSVSEEEQLIFPTGQNYLFIFLSFHLILNFKEITVLYYLFFLLCLQCLNSPSKPLFLALNHTQISPT